MLCVYSSILYWLNMKQTCCSVYCVSFQMALAFHDNHFVNVGNDLLVVYFSHIVYTGGWMCKNSLPLMASLCRVVVKFVDNMPSTVWLLLQSFKK